MVDSGKALYCLEASSLNIQYDITDLCACMQTAQTFNGVLTNLSLSSKYDTALPRLYSLLDHDDDEVSAMPQCKVTKRSAA